MWTSKSRRRAGQTRSDHSTASGQPHTGPLPLRVAQSTPRRHKSLLGSVEVRDEISDTAVRTTFDLPDALFGAAGVLVALLADQRAFHDVPVAVGVPSEVRDQMPSGPPREQRWLAGLLIGKKVQGGRVFAWKACSTSSMPASCTSSATSRILPATVRTPPSLRVAQNDAAPVRKFGATRCAQRRTTGRFVVRSGSRCRSPSDG